MPKAHSKLVHGSAALREWNAAPLAERVQSFYNVMSAHPDLLHEDVRLPKAAVGRASSRPRAGKRFEPVLTLGDVGTIVHHAGSIPEVFARRPVGASVPVYASSSEPHDLKDVSAVFNAMQQVHATGALENRSQWTSISSEDHFAHATQYRNLVTHLWHVIKRYGARLDGPAAQKLAREFLHHRYDHLADVKSTNYPR